MTIITINVKIQIENLRILSLQEYTFMILQSIVFNTYFVNIQDGMLKPEDNKKIFIYFLLYIHNITYNYIKLTNFVFIEMVTIT